MLKYCFTLNLTIRKIMHLYTFVLLVHIVGGFLALVTATLACFCKQFSLQHKWHAYSGKVFMLGYLVIFFTALILVFLKTNIFLLLIALFSFYLALSGFRYAKNKKGAPLGVDWVLQMGFLLITLIMIGFGLFSLAYKQTEGIVIIVFGAIGVGFSVVELKSYLTKKSITGNARIAKHLSFMLGASIGTVTAFVVTNFVLQPALILWLAPTVVITPYIFYWKRKLLKNAKKTNR